MLQELLFIHTRLQEDECMRIILTRNDWEIHVNNDELVTAGNGCFRIIRKNGNITSINPDQVACVCVAKRGALL